VAALTNQSCLRLRAADSGSLARSRAEQRECGDLVDISHRNVLLCELAFALGALRLLVLTLKDVLAVLVKLQLGDDALGWVDADLHRGACVYRIDAFPHKKELPNLRWSGLEAGWEGVCRTTND